MLYITITGSAGAGKTHTADHLAKFFTEQGKTVSVVECEYGDCNKIINDNSCDVYILTKYPEGEFKEETVKFMGVK